VADRVRSLAAMAGGISHHLRNSMTALTCFLEEAAGSAGKDGGSPAPAGPDQQFTEQLWTLAQKERQHLLQIVHRVGQTMSESESTFGDELDTAELVTRAQSAATTLAERKVESQIAADAPRLKLDAAETTIALRILMTYVARLSEPTDPITVTAQPVQVGGAGGVRIRVACGTKPWTEQDVAAFFTPFAFPASDPSDLGVELLRAFSVAYHHGGDIIVNRSAPAGPGFELLLPVDPAQVTRPDLQDGLLEKLFTHFETAAAPATPVETKIPGIAA